MRWVVLTDNGHGWAEVAPLSAGEGIQIALYGPRGGFHGGATFDFAAALPQLNHSIAKASEEAAAIYAARPLPDGFEDRELSAVAELGTH